MSQPTWENSTPVSVEHSLPTSSVPTWDNSYDPEEKYGTLGQQAITAAEGFGRGASLGGTDWLEKALGVDPKDIKGRQEENPLTSGASEVAGGIGSAILAPELSPIGLLGKGAKAAAELSGSEGVLGSAVKGAVEGFGLGAGHINSEMALGDPTLNSQKIMSQLGAGALGGGIIGGSFDALGPAIKTTGKAAEKYGAKAWHSIVGAPGEEAGLPIKAFNYAAGQATGKDSDLLNETWSRRNNFKGMGDFAEKIGLSGKAESPLNAPAFYLAAKMAGIPSSLAGGAIAGAEMVMNPVETLVKLNKIEELTLKATRMIANKSKNALLAVTEPAIIAGSKIEQESEADKLDRFNDVTSKISKLSTNPNLLLDHMTNATNSLHQVAPNITQGIHNTTATAIQFLNSKIPQQHLNDALGDPHPPSSTDASNFLKYFDAVKKPMHVLDEIKNNNLSVRSIEALKTVYPELHQEMSKALLQEAVKNRKTIPYQKKMQLSMFFGKDLDSSTEPQMIASNQNSFNTQKMNSPTQQSKSKTSSKGLDKLNVAGRTLTPLDKAASRQEER